MNFGTQRYRVVALTATVPISIVLTICGVFFIAKRLPTPSRTIRCCLKIAFSTYLGAVLALWAHALPCLYYTCDGGPWDNVMLRQMLLWLVGPLVAAMTTQIGFPASEPVKDPPIGVIVVEQSHVHAVSAASV